jgi:hypothetical protein
MPIVAHVVCDGCQAVKKDTNHWYASSIENNSFCIRPLDLPADWATKNFPFYSVQYFCGRFCALAALTHWMNKLSDEAALFPTNGKDVPIGRPFSAVDSDETPSAPPDRDIRSTLQGHPNTCLLES